MAVNINLRVTPFGQLILEIGKPLLSVVESPTTPTTQGLHYTRPLQTASGIYEVQYEQESANYIVPLSTA
jgi:hypothetical protein